MMMPFAASAEGCDGAEQGDSLYVAIIQSNLGTTGLDPSIFVLYICVSPPPPLLYNQTQDGLGGRVNPLGTISNVTTLATPAVQKL
jgi:hypothetical protein